VTLAGTAGCWFLPRLRLLRQHDLPPQIIALIAPHASQTATIAIELAIFAVAAVPGYVLAIARMDRIGHRRLQFVGFVLMAPASPSSASFPHDHGRGPFMLAYGISYFLPSSART